MPHPPLTEPEYALLALLGEETLPLGAGALRLALEARGFHLSEATAGRILQRLDRLGYTERCGFQGRRLSPEGRRLYEAHRILQHRMQSARGVMSALNDEDRRVIVETLEVRRALEGESARLAAERATEEDLALLRSLVEEQIASVKAGQSMATSDGVFHRALARASGNRLLESSIDLLRQDPLWAPLLECVRRKQGSPLGADHRAVLEAVASRDPQGARSAMERHLDNVLRDVRLFLESHPEGFGELFDEGIFPGHDAP
ncbi:MAG TPA: FCD domain-containing protein [Synergistaceae bacterium]|nr:FCD domain-containing protein [Synergistaceae bacterium]